MNLICFPKAFAHFCSEAIRIKGILKLMEGKKTENVDLLNIYLIMTKFIFINYENSN